MVMNAGSRPKSLGLDDALVLRLPAHAGHSGPLSDAQPFSFLRVAHDRIVERGRATRARLPVTRQTVLLVAVEDVLLLEREVPPLSERKLRAALPGLVEEVTFADLASLHVATSAAIGNRRLLAVLDRTLLTDWLAYFASSGRRITHVWCESLALPFQAGTWTLSLRAPEQGGGALLRLSQDTVLSLSDPIEANQALLAHALLSQPKPSAIHAYGDAQALAPFEAWLRPLAVAPTRLGADGLNAFIEAPGSHPSIDLLQGEFAFGLSLAEWRQWRVAIALALAALLIHTVGLSVRANQLAADKRELIAQQAATLKHAFPDTTVVLDAPAQMRRALGALQQHIGQSNASDFETLLGHAGQLLSSLPANACSEMHFDEHALSLHLKAPSLTSSAAQSTLVRAAAALGESATLTTAGGNEGDLTLRLAPKGGA